MLRLILLRSVPIIGVALMAACSLLLWGGSPEGAVHRLSGRSIYVSPDEIQFEAGIIGAADIHVSSLANHSITVLGSALPCECLQFDSLPIRVPSGKTVSLQLRFTGKQTAGLLHGYFTTDEPGQGQLPFRIKIVE